MTAGRRTLPPYAALVTALVAGALIAATAFTGGHGTPGARSSPAAPGPRPAAAPVAPPATPYERSVDVAHGYGMRIWLEADMVKRWRRGPTAFTQGVRMLATLSRRPGVVGIKIADELAYHDGLRTPREVLRFLRDTAGALRRAAPGTQLLADIMIPELGCLPDRTVVPVSTTICAARLRARHPALTLDDVDTYVRSGSLDVIDVSTGLLQDATYRDWGASLPAAQVTAWREIDRRRWSDRVVVQGRRAMAHPAAYPGTPAAAENEVGTWVDLPLSAGADAVDVWTWRQRYRGEVYRLLDPGMRDNPLWRALAARRARGARLFTHFTPSSTEVGVGQDLRALSRVFTDVFVAAGTG